MKGEKRAIGVGDFAAMANGKRKLHPYDGHQSCTEPGTLSVNWFHGA